MAKITIFGLGGAGTSTLGRMLAERLGYKFTPIGDLFRKKASELGLSLHELSLIRDQDPSIDNEIDQQVATYGKENNNFIFESRLPWYFIPDSLKIKIECELTVRLKRIAKRDGISFKDAREKTALREEGDTVRYRKLYGIENIDDDSHFDLILNSTSTKPEELCNLIEEKLRG